MAAPSLYRLIAVLVLSVVGLMAVSRRILLLDANLASLQAGAWRGAARTRSAPDSGPSQAGSPRAGHLIGKAPGAAPAQLSRCPLDCSGVGTCDEVTGRCSCPLTRAGPGCASRTQPACEASSAGDELNLSLLATQSFWQGAPNLASGEEPLLQFLGPLPCACVLQAVASLAGAHTGAFSAWWGAAPEMLYVARVPCLRAPAAVTVAALAAGGEAAAGARGDGGAAPAWASVAVFAWDFKLANNPFLLLPPLREHALWAPARWPRREHAPPSTQLVEGAVGDTWVSALQADVAADGGSGGSSGAHGARAGVDAAVAALAAPPAGWRPPVALRPAAECAGGCAGGGFCVSGPAVGAPGSAAHCECFARMGSGLEGGGARARSTSEGCAAPAGPPAAGAASSRFGPDRWRRWHWDRHYDYLAAELPDCPNGCSGVGRCAYGFCACPPGSWGLDCGLTRERALRELGARSAGGPGGPRPRVFVHNVPPAARRACSPWVLPEQLGDALLRSHFSTALPDGADYFWIYGCSLPGSLFVHALDFVRTHSPHWNRTAAAAAHAGGAVELIRAPGGGAPAFARVRALPSAPGHVPIHLFVSPSEHGWAEAWQAVWFGRSTRSALSPRQLLPGSAWWRQLAPDSPERLVGSLQLEGATDTKFKPELPPCHICFQKGKDVMVPTFQRTNDYPTGADCARLRRGLSPWSAAAAARARATTAADANADGPPDFETERPVAFFFAGSIQTKKDVQPSRHAFWRLWRNASGFRILQTERHPLVVDPADGWSEHVDLYAELRAARTCMVPLGKTGNYGQRMIPSVLAGCIPVITKPAGSAQLLEESLPWPLFSLSVPPERAPELGAALAGLDRERRRAMQRELGCAWRRLLWTSIYGNCVGTEGAHRGEPDAFATLMDALRRRAEGLPPAASACAAGATSGGAAAP